MATPQKILTPDEASLKDLGSDYTERYGFHDAENYLYKAPKGLSREIVEKISELKDEPEWMREFRLKALDYFEARPMPTWGSPKLAEVDFDDIHYFVRASERSERSWDDVPEDVKKTFDRLGIPEAERKFLAGVGAQYESEVVYHQVNEELEAQGVIFTDMDTALREHGDLVKEYLGTIIPPNDNKLAALNSAVWSGGSFVYVPPGVKVEQPLQAYFRINTENMGQFERTIIIADEGSYVHYVEGCTAPTYSGDSLHSAVVELIAKPGEFDSQGILTGTLSKDTGKYGNKLTVPIPAKLQNNLGLYITLTRFNTKISNKKYKGFNYATSVGCTGGTYKFGGDFTFIDGPYNPGTDGAFPSPSLNKFGPIKVASTSKC